MRRPSSFSLCHPNATSLPSGEKAGFVLAPGELVKGTILGVAPKAEELPLWKWSQPIPAARVITATTAKAADIDTPPSSSLSRRETGLRSLASETDKAPGLVIVCAALTFDSEAGSVAPTGLESTSGAIK